jgi:hypothetical protein
VRVFCVWGCAIRLPVPLKPLRIFPCRYPPVLCVDLPFPVHTPEGAAAWALLQEPELPTDLVSAIAAVNAAFLAAYPWIVVFHCRTAEALPHHPSLLALPCIRYSSTDTPYLKPDAEW